MIFTTYLFAVVAWPEGFGRFGIWLRNGIRVMMLRSVATSMACVAGLFVNARQEARYGAKESQDVFQHFHKICF